MRCPFCGSAALARPGAVRTVSRRAFTRAAVFVGAAVLTACGGDEIAYEGEEAGTGGGEETDFASDTDADGSDQVSREHDEREMQQIQERERQAEERRLRDERAMEELERQRELEEQDWRDQRRHRNPCVDGVCPPYGTPPARDLLV